MGWKGMECNGMERERSEVSGSVRVCPIPSHPIPSHPIPSQLRNAMHPCLHSLPPSLSSFLSPLSSLLVSLRLPSFASVRCCSVPADAACTARRPHCFHSPQPAARNTAHSTLTVLLLAQTHPTRCLCKAPSAGYVMSAIQTAGSARSSDTATAVVATAATAAAAAPPSTAVPASAVSSNRPVAVAMLQTLQSHHSLPPAAAALSVPLLLPLLRSIRGAVLSCVAADSELRVRLCASERAVSKLRTDCEAAAHRADCSEQLKRLRDDECAASQSALLDATARERRHEAQAEQWRTQLVACRSEAEEKLQDAQQQLSRVGRAHQSASAASREVRRLSESTQQSERQRAELETALESERVARQAAEQRAATAEQVARDREIDEAGRHVEDEGRAAAASRLNQLQARLTAVEERLAESVAQCREAEGSRRQSQLKMDRMRAFIQQQQRDGHSASGAASVDRDRAAAGCGSSDDGGGSRASQRVDSKRERPEQPSGQSRKQKRSK